MRATTLTMTAFCAGALLSAGCPRQPAEQAGEQPVDQRHDAEPAKRPAEEEPPPPAAEEPAVDLLHAVATEVAVSSAYHDDATQVARLVDGSLESAWNSRSEDLAGAWIEVVLPESASVEGIEMTAGYTKTSGTRDLFTGNHRVKRVRVLRGSELVGTYPLDLESRALQKLPVKGGGGVWRIELAELAAGTQPTWREACVSELRVTGRAPGARAGTETPATRVGPAGAEAAADAGAADGAAAEAGPDAGSVTPGDQGGGLALAPEITEADGILLTELTLAAGVEERVPVDPRATFSKASDERVYCYVKLQNKAGSATKVQISSERVDGPPGRPGSLLDVPAAPRYTTWSWFGTGWPAGRYRCVVRSEKGSVLGRIEYELAE